MSGEQQRLEEAERKVEQLLAEVVELRKLANLVLQQVRAAGGGS